MKKTALLMCVLGIVSLAGIRFKLYASAPAEAARRQPVDWVNPFVGTTQPGLRWMLFPGPAMQLGIACAGPKREFPFDHAIARQPGDESREWFARGNEQIEHQRHRHKTISDIAYPGVDHTAISFAAQNGLLG